MTGATPPAQRLADARLYLCTDAREVQGDLEEFLDAVLANGVDIVQLRQKGLEARQELAYLDVFAAAAARHGALLAANDRADIAATAAVDVLHLGQNDLPLDAARDIVGDGTLIGCSTHTRDQVDEAAASPVSTYFCVGPTWSTPTKPRRPATGVDLTRYAATSAPGKPWFAIGGIDLTNLDRILAAGARRVVVVRAITEASDPGAAAADLALRLRMA